MRRLAVVLAAMLAAVSIYAVTAPAGPQARDPRFTGLSKRVTQLQAQVRTLAGCTLVRAIPIGVYGAENEGYVYRQTNGQLVTTSALDVVPQGQQPTFWALATSPQCAQQLNRRGLKLYRLSK